MFLDLMDETSRTLDQHERDLAAAERARDEILRGLVEGDMTDDVAAKVAEGDEAFRHAQEELAKTRRTSAEQRAQVEAMLDEMASTEQEWTHLLTKHEVRSREELVSIRRELTERLLRVDFATAFERPEGGHPTPGVNNEADAVVADDDPNSEGGTAKLDEK